MVETKEMLPEIVTVREAAAYARVTSRTIQRWVEEGILPGVKLGGTIRIRREDLQAILTPRIEFSFPSPFRRPTPLPRPQKESLLFEADENYGCTGVIGDGVSTWITYADGYWAAAKTLMQYLINLQVKHQNNAIENRLVYPLVFLYRQAVELQLKGFLNIASSLYSSRQELQNHNIFDLWGRCRQVLEKEKFPDATVEDLDVAEEYIKQLYEKDANGLAFLFPINEHGSVSHRGQTHVGLQNFSETMEWIILLLDKASNFIYVCLDLKREYELDCE